MTVSTTNSNTKLTKQILIVDDDKSITRVLSTLLNKYGKIAVADCGNKAMQLMMNEEFDLVLTDFEMEQGSGIDLLDYMLKYNIKVPTIMVTSRGSKNLVLETMKYHIFGFVEKPFNQQSIQSLVEEGLKVKEEQDKIIHLAMLGTTAGELVHEISNPLSVLDLNISMLKEEGSSPEMDKLSSPMDRIKNIIDSTRKTIKSEKMGDHEIFDLNEAIEESKDEINVRSQKRKVTVSIQGNFHIKMKGDRHKIRQAVVNLVNNAIDAASGYDEKWVRVTLNRLAKSIEILITDSGNGIPEEIQQKLFQSLFSTKGNTGTGLGLGVVRKIAKEHEGSITLNNNCKNTQFVLTLPTLD
jgi:two-component system, NtrC family, sensor kinase